MLNRADGEQIAYFAAVPKDEIMSSGRILAASFFRNMFGNKAERALSVFVALSAFGNVLSVIFSQGRRALLLVHPLPPESN
jgi:hypothetical protein